MDELVNTLSPFPHPALHVYVCFPSTQSAHTHCAYRPENLIGRENRLSGDEGSPDEEGLPMHTIAIAIPLPIVRAGQHVNKVLLAGFGLDSAYLLSRSHLNELSLAVCQRVCLCVCVCVLYDARLLYDGYKSI